jgi:hypothetical protein
MKTPLTALALTLAILSGSVLAAAAEERAREGFHAQLYGRYCDKLREGAEQYVLFVRRLAPIHGYTYWDFAPQYPGAPVVMDCRVSAERVAEVKRRVMVAEAPEQR